MIIIRYYANSKKENGKKNEITKCIFHLDLYTKKQNTVKYSIIHLFLQY